jgi:hypothetical protein
VDDRGEGRGGLDPFGDAGFGGGGEPDVRRVGQDRLERALIGACPLMSAYTSAPSTAPITATEDLINTNTVGQVIGDRVRDQLVAAYDLLCTKLHCPA